jgi:hypothetical protein
MRLKILVSVCSLVLLTSLAHGQKWRFIVAGDGRADTKVVRPEDHDGINALITGEICQAVIDENAKFLAWTGDLVYGYQKKPEDFEAQLLAWVKIMQPLYDRHIPVLATRGNHDAGSTDADKVWRKVFSGPYAMPQNGPAGEEGMTFYYGKGDVLMIGLDQYGSRKETVNQAWLDDVFQRYPKPFVFTMGHEPAFMDGSHKDNMDADVARRDAFWESLIKVGSRVFFAGHDHLYDHMTVRRKGINPGPEMHQIVAGTAGAPFYDMGEYAGNNNAWLLTRTKHIDRTYGYVLVEIDGDRATVSFKGRTAPGKYEVMDSFTFVTPKPAKRMTAANMIDD